MVEVTLNGWDTDNFTRSEKLMAQWEPAMSALLDDLKARYLHRRTLVDWVGDFGRTPRINGNEGRDHHPRAWSAVVSGTPHRTAAQPHRPGSQIRALVG